MFQSNTTDDNTDNPFALNNPLSLFDTTYFKVYKYKRWKNNY